MWRRRRTSWYLVPNDLLDLLFAVAKYVVLKAKQLFLSFLPFWVSLYMSKGLSFVVVLRKNPFSRFSGAFDVVNSCQIFLYLSSVPCLFSHSFWLERRVGRKQLLILLPVGTPLVGFCALLMVGVRRGRIQVPVSNYFSLREHLRACASESSYFSRHHKMVCESICASLPNCIYIFVNINRRKQTLSLVLVLWKLQFSCLGRVGRIA